MPLPHCGTNRYTSPMASRETMNISLPPALRDWVDSQVESGRYGSASEYIRELLRQAQDVEARGLIDKALQDGIASGFRPMDEAAWREIKRRSRKLQSAARPTGARRKRSA